MKNFFSSPNVQAVFLLMLSVTEFIVILLCKPLSLGIQLFFLILSLAGIALIRFAYHIALLGNILHSRWYREHSDEADDEPSRHAIRMVKYSGYGILFVLQILMFF